MSALCAFGDLFTSNEVHDFLLPLLVACVNEQDWHLRLSFFMEVCYLYGTSEHSCGGALLKIGSLVQLPRIPMRMQEEEVKKFLLPCMEEALRDEEFSVVACSLGSVARVLESPSLSLKRDEEVIDRLCEHFPRLVGLVRHPHVLVRSNMSRFISAVVNYLGKAGKECSFYFEENGKLTSKICSNPFFVFENVREEFFTRLHSSMETLFVTSPSPSVLSEPSTLFDLVKDPVDEKTFWEAVQKSANLDSSPFALF